MKDDYRRSIAIEELKLLSSIIGRIETAIFQRHALLFTLITGLALALLKEQPLISKHHFAILSASITIVFWIADAIQRVPVHRAIKRSREIEKSLRDNHDLSSPLIADSLSKGKSVEESFKDFRKCLFRFRVWTPYLATLAAAGIIFFIAPK